jgi:lipopolysaccharide export system permease protein
LVHVDQLAGRGSALTLQGVDIYGRSGGSVVHVTEAENAFRDPVNDRWVLRNARRYDAAQGVVSRHETLPALAGVAPDRFILAKVVPAERDFFDLRQAIAELEAAGRPTDEALTGWWHKLSGPLSTVLMPLLAAMAAFGLARSGQVLLRATIGMALGFAYFVVDNFSIALGNVGAYPPVLAAWAPFALFLLIGETVLIRSEE